MARLIYADALETRMGSMCDEFDTDHLFIDAIVYEIGNAPTVDAVEVVRCKDCKFIHDKGYCTLVTGMTRIKPDDFCSRGERRTE